jgi:P27 family predicted phage terminase small subunit
MGKRGPPPEPSILRYIRGNPSKTPLNDGEPTPDLLSPGAEPPVWLEGVALDKWHEIVPVLTAMRVMTIADRETIARYCALWEQWKKNYDIVKRGADVIIGRDAAGEVKYMQVTPYASQMTKIATLLLRIEQEFGLTPSSRSQVTIHGSRDDDPLATFAQKRSGGAGA